MSEGQYFQAIQRKDRVSVQDFVQSGSAAYQWSDEREKSSIHHLCQYFDKDVFDYVWSKLKTEPDLVQKWNKVDRSGRLPQHLLAKNKTDEVTKMQIKTCLEQLMNHSWGENQSFDLEAKDGMGCTLLDYAKESQNEPLVKFLKQKLFHEVQLPSTEQSITFQNFWEAIEKGDVKDCEKFFQDRYLLLSSPSGRNCLQQAVFEEKHSVIDFLLKQDAIDPNAKGNKDFYPPIFLACRNLDSDSFNKLFEHKNLNDLFETQVEIKVEDDKVDVKNVMHILINENLKFKKDRSLSFENIKIMHKILSKIIEKDPEKAGKLINQADLILKRTPLHYATELPGQAIVKLLLNNQGEKSLFKKDAIKNIPINHMDVETTKEWLDDQMVTKGPLYHDHFEVNFDLDFLVPKIDLSSNEDPEGKALLEDSGYPIHKTEVFEFENLAMIADEKIEFFDHPIIASMILKKMHRVEHFLFAISMVKLFMHMFGISYAMITYGGKSWPGFDPGRSFPDDLPKDCFCRKNGCPVDESNGLWIAFNVTFFLNILRMIFVLVCMIRPDSWTNTRANFKFTFSQGESKLSLAIALTIIPLLWMPLSADWKRDLAGFYVFLAFFETCFIWRNHFPNKKMASMITWTEVVSSSILEFLAMHWMIIVGFALAFYIQLHNDYDGPKDYQGDGKTFNDIVNLPIKIIAMAIGEFEYGDMPFRNFSMDQFLFLNRLTFILFVYFIALVMMNLLTGMAIMDVQEIKNASLDKTWHEMMWKVILLENGLYRSFKFAYDKCKVFKSEVDRKVRLMPNRTKEAIKDLNLKIDSAGPQDLNSEKVVKIIWEESINENAKNIAKTRIENEEKSFFPS